MKQLKRAQNLFRTIGARDGDGVEGGELFRTRYAELPREARWELFRWMGAEIEVSREDLEEATAKALGEPPGDAARWADVVEDLRRAIASPRRRALENLVDIPGGMEFILGMRAEVLQAQRSGSKGLESVDREIADLLNSWCRHGFLFLEEVDRTSSFSKIRYLKERELVHPMVSLEEMGRRLGRDRMCFALCHVAMPDEPVVFIEVALSRGLVRSIHDIIGHGGEERHVTKSPDTAIFYSINNTQNGLAGLGLGKVLIFRVTEALRERHPGVTTLATLSPIPGLWPGYLKPILEGEDGRFRLKRPDVLEKLSPAAHRAVTERYRASGGAGEDVAEALVAVLSDPGWIDDVGLVRHLKKPLIEIAHFHVAEETDPKGKPLNPVAGFHLGNGASISKKNVNFAANTSPRGLADSCGLMTNYVYSASTFARIGRTVRALLPWARR